MPAASATYPMSIAAANLFTRNIYTRYANPGATDAEEARVAKITSMQRKPDATLPGEYEGEPVPVLAATARVLMPNG
jgi:Na+(H+)/acetate symporter ActP